MGLRDKLKTRAVEVIKEAQIGPPAVVGEDISLFTAVYGEQRPKRNERDGIRFYQGAEAEAHLEGLSDAQRAGYSAQAELLNRQERGSDG